MKTAILALAVVTAPVIAGQPSQDVTKTCVSAESTSARVKYAEVTVHEILEAEDEDTKRTEITVRSGSDKFGVWQSSSPDSFGLVYNGREIPLSSVARLSSEMPVPFNPYLARWGLITEGVRSYLCITFNFDGLGRSGSFQNVRGVYLIDRADRNVRTFYTVGRTTPDGVVLAKRPQPTRLLPSRRHLGDRETSSTLTAIPAKLALRI